MAYSYTSLVLQRIAIPIVLVLAALFRPVGISFVYLLMFFVSPFIPVATQRNFKGPVTAYLVILIAQSTLLILCHIALQLTIISLKMDNIFSNCSFTEQLLRHVGFVDFRNLKPLAIFEWLIPEVVVFITSLCVYLTTKRLVTRPHLDAEHGEGIEPTTSNEIVVTSDVSAGSLAQTQTKKIKTLNEEPNFDRLISISPLFCMAVLFFAGVLRPSVPGGFYFLIFLLAGTYWATIKNLGRGFAFLLRVVLIILVAHLLFVVAYQTPWMQQHLSKTDLVARLLGLEPLVKSTCDDIRIIIYDTENYEIDSYFNPLALCLAFYTLSLTAKNLSKAPTIAKPANNVLGQQLENGSNKFSRQLSRIKHPSRTSKKDKSWTNKTQRLNVSLRREREQRPKITEPTEPTETTPLVRSVKKPRSSTDGGDENNAQQTTGSDIRLDSLEQIDEPANETRTTIVDQISYGFISVGGFIYQNSYIFTNILMMAWSIVYHSWLTFVLLLWANLLWMIPNQRKAMMRCSPFIVLYAELLLITQYIYGMDLTNEELPSKVNITGINLRQIGLDRPQEHGVQPCLPLIVKTSFLLMFWVTLRQFLKEKKEKRRDSTIADIFAPLSLTVSTAGATQTDGDKKSSRFLKKAGDIFKNLLVRLWIWLLVLVIFLCAITGSKMTGFRICYMALFLFFLLVFQSSSKAWVKIMYGFWLFLIFYVMSILILIYTYQFDKFDDYWYKYLNIQKKLQQDIGLERYETKDLFLHLVSPTLIVILTVIQVHYFHKRFIEALQQKPITRSTSHKSFARVPSNEHVQPASATQTDLKKSVLELFKIFLARLKRRTQWILRHFKDVFWRFLELHLLKLVYLTGFICSVSEVCVLHIFFVALCLMGVCSRASVQHFISRIISLIVSIIVLAKMIYQVTYVDHTRFDNICGNSNKTVNDADWFGLTKAKSKSGGLMDLLKPYIIYMIMVTLHAVVTLRQLQMRTLLGYASQQQSRVLFPKITRADAEKNLNKMIKYLFNYGFYKFGLETSLIWLVSTITFRQDIIAVLYVFWLIGFLMLKRRQVARIWIVFEWFVGIAIIVEYLLLVGLPPHLCTSYPWNNTVYAISVQRWAMLPGSLNLEHVSKLIFDFILLMFINRQRRVFSIEKRTNDTSEIYLGGSNRSVIKDIAKLGQVPFENPTRDFLSTVRNYLDIFQNVVLSGFYWITLAVVFVGGTNIFDLLALGYLIGAFVFLWEGSDFYLRPIDTILTRWKWLIAYNVSNIFVKTLLQIAGCIFMEELRQYACWLVHVLGISCAARPRPLVVLLADVDENPASPRQCPESTAELVLVWDAICFAFLILQLRIFKSHYFCHIIIDTRANNLLASRGAEIIEDLRQKQIEHRKEHDDEVLLKIKRKMEKIRATQQKMLRPIDKPTHFDERGNPVPALRAPKRKEPKLHAEAVRAGDYYMFEDVDEKFELDIIDDHKDFLDEHEQLTESEKKISRRKTLFDVWKDLQSEGYRRRLYLRQRSYASAPGSHFGFNTIGDEDYILGDNTLEMVWDGEAGVRTSTYSEPLMPLRRVKSESLGSKRKESISSDKGREIERERFAHEKDYDEPDEAYELGRTSEDQAHSDAERLAKQAEDEELTANPIVRLLEGFLVSLIMRLNRFSRNYRYVNKILAEEKRILKESTNLNRMGRPGAASMFNVFRKNIERSEKNSSSSLNKPTVIIPEIRIIVPSAERSRQGSFALYKNWSHEFLVRVNKFSFDDAEFAARDHHIIVEVLISCWYAILSNTDLICYIVIFINQICNASIISLPLPIMVFLWGTLSLPRPTKTFWVTLIAYTQAIVLIKCVFQYKLIWQHYSDLPNKPLAWAKIFGVEERTNYANIDLLVLLVLFLHRFILKSHGLWKTKYSLTSEDDLKTIESPENENAEQKAGSTGRQVALTSSDEIEDWGDAQSNPEIIEEARRRERLSKQNDDNSSRGREKGGLDRGDTLSEASDKYLQGLQRLKRAKYLSSLRKFFYNLLHRPRLPDDVYALMFLCDFINFFVLLFGFSAFSSRQTDTDDGGVQAYLAENKVPIPFLIMLLIQFLLIVIDRALYLRKALIPKIVFHFLSVIGIHIWMFFVVPAVTERSFYKLAPPIIFYIFKCFYMLLSSYQIKCGYPRRILGNFLTKSFSIANMIMLKIFMAIPFLYELRTILDWVCTDTTMTLFDWLKMEDIFAEVFFIRCSRQMEQDFPAIRAEKKALHSKLILGGFGILAIAILIWGPLCLFALGKTVGQSNVPYEVRVTIRIGPYDPIYDTNNRESIYTFNDFMFSEMQEAYKAHREPMAFFSGYDATDIAGIKLAGNAPSLWQISPPDRDRLLADLESNQVLTARFTYFLTRVLPGKGLLGTVNGETTLDINSTFPGRKNMIDMLKGSNSTGEVVLLPDLVPKFLKILNAGDVTVVNTLMLSSQRYRPLVLTIRGSPNSTDLWWEIRDHCDDSFHKDVLSKLPLVNCSSGIVMYTFNDKKFPSTFSFLTAGGIFGLYTTFVLVISRLLRGFMVGQNRKIMFEDLPYVDRVLQLCLDIYLVREALEFALEEDLFAKLIFLYRSPETLIKWTRPKEELRDDETDSESVPSRSSMRRPHERGEQH